MILGDNKNLLCVFCALVFILHKAGAQHVEQDENQPRFQKHTQLLREVNEKLLFAEDKKYREHEANSHVNSWDTNGETVMKISPEDGQQRGHDRSELSSMKGGRGSEMSTLSDHEAALSILSSEVESDRMSSYLSRNHDNYHGKSVISCDLCKLFVTSMKLLLLRNASVEEFTQLAIDICYFFTTEDHRICTMLILEYRDEVKYVVAHLVLSPDEVCGMFLGKGCSTPYFPGEAWNVTLPDVPKPTPKPPQPPKPQSPTLRFLHLTDIHLDFMYRPGETVHCGEPVCCRLGDNTTMSTSNKHKSKGTAGLYGSYVQCDAPELLLHNMFEHFRTIEDQFDYVIFTGDIPAHDIWNQTKSDQLMHLRYLDKLFTEYLPQKPVYACLGNHESAPIDSFPPPGIPGHSMEWLYGELLPVWGKWLSPSQLPQVNRCGSYSFSPYPGFRIISLNNNYCNSGNVFLFLNSTDPCDLLSWFIEELQSAENKGEKVHILTHIPPGLSYCMKYWSQNFYKIVNRYENTIVNQFYGHDHHDWYEMFYDDVSFQRPVGFGFVAPSTTPWVHNNPSYRIYTMDGNYNGSSWAVLDYHTYYFNLTKANTLHEPSWVFGHSPKELYNMTSLYAADWEDLLQRMEADDDLFQTFYRSYHSEHYRKPCHEACKVDLLCRLKEGRSFDPDLCIIHK